MSEQSVWRSGNSEAFNGVQTALRNYIDGVYRSGANLLAQVFHPSAHLYSVDKDGGRCIAVGLWIDAVRAREPLTVSNRLEEVRSISFVNANMAVARVSIENVTSSFEDCLVLMHDRDSWKVISKAYAIRPKT